MIAANKFIRGAGGVFKCDVCTRSTRFTGEQSRDSRLCPQCWELAGLENSVLDGEPVDNVRAYAEELAAEIRAKGGKPDVAFLTVRKRAKGDD